MPLHWRARALDSLVSAAAADPAPLPRFAFCGQDGRTCLSAARGPWQEMRDAAKRLEMYARMQRLSMERSPFVFLLQNAELATMPKNVSGIVLGLLPDYVYFSGITKG